MFHSIILTIFYEDAHSLVFKGKGLQHPRSVYMTYMACKAGIVRGGLSLRPHQSVPYPYDTHNEFYMSHIESGIYITA